MSLHSHHLYFRLKIQKLLKCFNIYYHKLIKHSIQYFLASQSYAKWFYTFLIAYHN